MYSNEKSRECLSFHGFWLIQLNFNSIKKLRYYFHFDSANICGVEKY